MQLQPILHNVSKWNYKFKTLLLLSGENFVVFSTTARNRRNTVKSNSYLFLENNSISSQSLSNIIFNKDDIYNIIYLKRRSKQSLWSRHQHLLNTLRKKKFSIKDFLSKCAQVHSFLRVLSHLLKKPSTSFLILWQMGQGVQE